MPHRRLFVAGLISLTSFLAILFITILLQLKYNLGEADMTYVFCEARAVLTGEDPYGVCAFSYHGSLMAPYPLTASLYGISFVPFAPYSGPVLFAVSCGLLAFAATRRGQWWRLLVFFTIPFEHAMVWLQWVPFLLAIYFLPDLLPLSLVKPQLAIPVILTRSTRPRVVGTFAFLAFTLFLDPTWPLRWWHQAQAYDGWIPLLRFPFGPLMLLTLLRWRNPRALFLFLFAAMPQRGYYDLLMLWAVPSTLPQMGLLTALSWFLPFAPMDPRDWALFILYLPSLVFVFYPTITAKLRCPVPTLGIFTEWRGTSGRTNAKGSS